VATTKANINVKIDASVKEAAAQMLTNMGIDLTTAVDMFFRQIIVERRLPFQPRVMATLDEQIAIAAKNIPTVKWESDGNGNVIIDKDSSDYEWAVEG